MDETYERDKQDVTNLYHGQWNRYGATAEGVGWRNEEEQELRFQLLWEPIVLTAKPHLSLASSDPLTSPITLLDVGCGYGAFWEFLRLRHKFSEPWVYTGVDINPQAIEVAKETSRTVKDHTAPRYVQEDFLTAPALPSSYHWVIASGTLNYYWVQHQLAILRRMWELAEVGVVFNVIGDPYLSSVQLWVKMFQPVEWQVRAGYIPESDEVTVVMWKVRP